MTRVFQTVFAIVLVLDSTFAGSIQCRDETGKPVDWFVAYKLPQIKQSPNKLVKDGVGYVYITSENLSQGWILSSVSCNNTKSILGKTLEVLYSNEVQSFSRILYNDEPPNGESSLTFGHTKGVVLANEMGGFWLVHSVPHFPPPFSSSYLYPHTGVRYGQSFLCISLPFNQLDTVGLQLQYNEPIIYDVEMPSNIGRSLPELTLASKGHRISQPPFFNCAPLSTPEGVSFKSFAKSTNFGKDLYADWVAADLHVDLVVETWSNGAGRMPSECNKAFKVENAELLSIGNTNFSTHQDHSKWAVALTDEMPWVCVGDINRMVHQEQRGGGTVCVMNMDLWNAYRHSVLTLDICPIK